ncbi:hypothetical protein HH214_17165 [Mucilaginibacter robiniae]|uniref:Uncharacterized protein n=1 Tax=Mucilaginibacter robiniae TaxID=2728022 RepID=A0A7L5E286_9SPHI|nr:hypothetical protein [Mucilaginibacter robiniae]QJD97480.1 hypothetical protein HH214_17165 [Mucilaginibacter robiniae]
MKEFEHLMSVWQTQPKPDRLSVDDVLKQVKKGIGSITRKLYWNIISTAVTAIIIFVGMLFAAVSYWTTYVGILIMLLAMVMSVYVMIHDYRLLNKNDITMSPADYLQSLKEYQRSRSKMYGWLYYLYMLLLSIGLSMYFIEILSAKTLAVRLIASSLTIAWLLFVTFYLKDRIFKSEQEKLNLMIDRLKRLQNQFE